MGDSGLFRVGANTDQPTTSRASLSVLGLQGGIQIDFGDVGDGSQPGDHIGELFGKILSIVTPQRGGQFTNLLHQPHKSSINSSRDVFLEVHLTDVLLQVRERQLIVRIGGRGHVDRMRRGQKGAFCDVRRLWLPHWLRDDGPPEARRAARYPAARKHVSQLQCSRRFGSDLLLFHRHSPQQVPLERFIARIDERNRRDFPARWGKWG